MSLRKKHTTKKAGRRRNDSNYEEYENDAESVASVASLSSTVVFHGRGDDQEEDSGDEEDSAESHLKDCLDQLSEKRASIRENAFKGLQKLLSDNYLGAELQASQETLLEACLRAARRGKSLEQTLALDALAISFVQFDDRDREGLYNSICPQLQTMVRDNTAAPAIRTVSVRALGYTCFLACRDTDRTQANMDIFLGLMQGSAPTPELCETAVSMWTLLLSSQPAFRARAYFDRTHETLKSLLEHADVDVRLAASEAIAVLVEACRTADENFDDGVADEMDIIIGDLAALSTDADKKRAKKDRSKQRSQVRTILRFVEEGDEPSEKLKIGHEAVEVEGWRETIHLNNVRALLGSGLQQHIMANPNVRALFGLGPPSLEAMLNPRERHAMHKQVRQELYVPRQKQRGQSRALARDHKQYSHADDYD